MADLNVFSRRMLVISEKIDKGINRNLREMALIIDRDVVFATPVDTGRARSNWVVSLNKAARDIRDAFSPGEGLGTGESSNAAGAIAQGQSVIVGRKPGQTIFISNNLPYIETLNGGSSAQAAQGFVQTAIQTGRSFFKRRTILK